MICKNCAAEADNGKPLDVLLCSVCAEPIDRFENTTVLWHHRSPGNQPWPWCEGGGKPPAPVGHAACLGTTHCDCQHRVADA